MNQPESAYYDYFNRTVVGGKSDKVRQYLREKLIKQKDGFPGVYLVCPGAGRHVTHEINILDQEGYNCTCQAYIMGDIECSHIMATKIYIERMDQGQIEQTTIGEHKKEQGSEINE